MRISDWSSDVCSSDLKPQLLEAATSNAREQATRFAEDAGATLGRLKNANQGVIRVIDDDGSDMDSGRTVGKRLRGVSRSEERRVGKECVRTCSSRWSPSHEKQK